MVKKIIFLLMFGCCVYASDKPKIITPADFTEKGKTILSNVLLIWTLTAYEENIPLDRGLAKIFYRMYKEDLDALINDQDALKKANEFNTSFVTSNGFKIMDSLNLLKPDGQGNYVFAGAQGFVAANKSALFQFELCNILDKDKALWKMPGEHLLEGFLASSSEKAKVILRLNEDNKDLQENAIRAQGLLSTYYRQQEG